MRFHRPERVSDLIIEEFNKIIVHELEFPGTLVTVIDVEVSKDLKVAKVKISVIPPEKTKKIFTALNLAKGRLQFLLHRKLNIRPMPRIEFEIDRGLEQAADIEKKLLDEYNKE